MTSTELEPTVAALAVQQPGDALVRPAASVSDIEQAFHAYQELCARLLDTSDYQGYMQWDPELKRKVPKKFRKRSAWRKLSTAMGVTFEIVSREKERGENGRILSADFVVRATAPNGRFVDGWGNCDAFERCTDKCAATCTGVSHFSKPEHDIPATAETRAKNRAAADLFGMGEVSAEEIAGAKAEPVEFIEDAVIVDPDGNVFPDQREPAQFVPPPGATDSDPNLATKPQLGHIGRLMGVLEKQDATGQITRETLKAEIQLAYGVTSSKELTKAEASQVIEGLKLRAGEE